MIIFFCFYRIDVQSACVPPIGFTEIRDDKCKYHLVKSDKHNIHCSHHNPPDVVE